MLPSAVTAIQKQWRPPIRRRELQPPRCRLVGALHLRDDAGHRSVAQCILRERKDVSVLASLSKQNAFRPKSHLLEARRIKVEPRQRPDYIRSWFSSEARGCSRHEQRSRGVVTQCSACGGKLVERGAVETTVRQTVIKLRNTERQHRAAMTGLRQLGTQRGQGYRLGPFEQLWLNGHQTVSTQLFAICSSLSLVRSSGVSRPEQRQRTCIALAAEPPVKCSCKQWGWLHRLEQRERRAQLHRIDGAEHC